MSRHYRNNTQYWRQYYRRFPERIERDKARQLKVTRSETPNSRPESRFLNMYQYRVTDKAERQELWRQADPKYVSSGTSLTISSLDEITGDLIMTDYFVGRFEPSQFKISTVFEPIRDEAKALASQSTAPEIVAISELVERLAGHLHDHLARGGRL